MKLPNDQSAYMALSWTIGVIILGLTIDAFFEMHAAQDNALLTTLHLAMVLLLTLALLILHLIRKKVRIVKETAHSRALLAMQREVDKTERRYQSLLECAGDAIFVICFENGRLAEVNRAATDLLGYSKEELGLVSGWELVPAEDQKAFTAFVRQVKHAGLAGPESITFRRKDGSIILGEVTARLIDLGDRRVVQAIIRDITLKQQAQQEIRQRNRKLSILNNIIVRASQNLDLPTVLDVTLLETLSGFGAVAGTIHLVDDGGRIGPLAAASNIKECFLTGARPGELPDGRPCPMTEKHTCQVHADLAKKECGMTAVVRSQGWRSVVGVPLFAKKRLLGVMHIMTTMERQYNAEDIKLFATMGNQIGIVIEHARLFAELNWKTDELLRSHGLLEKSSHQLAQSQQRLRKNLALVEQANAELERLNRMKNNFLGMVSHEFKTPLTGILSSVEFLLTNPSADRSAEERQLLETVYQCGARLNGIVNDLLKVARLEANAPSVMKTPLHLAELLNFLHEQSAPLLAERRQRIVFSDLNALPFFTGDRESLLEVFARLLENAIKFTPDGGEIGISARVVDRVLLEDKKEHLRRFNCRFYEQMGDSSFLQVEVRDSGVGIAAGEQLRVFDKFHEIGEIRFHSSGKSKFQGKGTGLGLTIVKGMVEAHGGMVWVESSLGSDGGAMGSSFFLLLPLEEASSQPAFPFMQAVPAPSLPKSFGSCGGAKDTLDNA
jgi:PAS domain S-box-containing protein